MPRAKADTRVDRRAAGTSAASRGPSRRPANRRRCPFDDRATRTGFTAPRAAAQGWGRQSTGHGLESRERRRQGAVGCSPIRHPEGLERGGASADPRRADPHCSADPIGAALLSAVPGTKLAQVLASVDVANLIALAVTLIAPTDLSRLFLEAPTPGLADILKPATAAAVAAAGCNAAPLLLKAWFGAAQIADLKTLAARADGPACMALLRPLGTTGPSDAVKLLARCPDPVRLLGIVTVSAEMDESVSAMLAYLTSVPAGTDVTYRKYCLDAMVTAATRPRGRHREDRHRRQRKDVHDL